MRACQRNKQPFYYALYEGKSEIVNDGLKTGEWETVYSEPIFMGGNISAAKGETETRMFGEDIDYDKVIFLPDAKTPINEYSVLWIDRFPALFAGTTPTPFDYVVKRVARSLTSTLIAIKKINISDPPSLDMLFCVNSLPKQPNAKYVWLDDAIWDDEMFWID